MIEKIKKAGAVPDMGVNIRAFEHFGTIAKRHVNQNEKHLNISKQGIKKFATMVSIAFDDKNLGGLKVDYSEFSQEPGKLVITPERINPPTTPEQFAGENSIPYDSMSLFLTIHDYQESLDEKLKGMSDMLAPKGKIFVVDYNFGAWLHKSGNPRQVFKKFFNAGYEPKSLENEGDCFEKHSWLSLDEIITRAQAAGFETRHAEAYKPQYSKFFLYIGGKR